MHTPEISDESIQLFRRLLEAILLTAALLSPLISRAGVPGIRSHALCLERSEEGQCSLVSAHSGLTLKLAGSEIAADLIDANRVDGKEKVTPSSAPRESRVTPSKISSMVTSEPAVSLSADLYQRVKEGRLSPDDALLIETELFSRRDASYFLPESMDEIKIAVGFPADELLSDEDSVELVKVHLQISLSVSPATASYLVERLGVKIDGIAASHLPSLPTNPPAPPEDDDSEFKRETLPAEQAQTPIETAAFTPNRN